jgi:hypothetical protein
MSSSNQPPRQLSGARRRPPDALPFDALPDASGPEEFELEPQIDDNVFEEADRGRRSGPRAWGARIFTRVAWLGLAAMLALGSAGIVAATSYSPVSGNRPELTSGADQALSDRLDAAIRELALLNDDVIVLGDMARKVLVNLSQVSQIGLDAAYQDGDAAVVDIDSRAAALSAQLECKPWTNARAAELVKTYSQGMVDRYHQVCLAIDSVAPLAEDWASMENGSKVAMQVADDINAHDQTAADGLKLATEGRYPEALAKLDEASASLADAQRIATNLAVISDVSTLIEWLSRTKGMDDALRLLWQTMIDSKGRITAQVTAALKAVTAAKALLPDNNGVLQVVLYEMAGSLTSDGISIETAKGKLGSALADLTGGTVLGG